MELEPTDQKTSPIIHPNLSLRATLTQSDNLLIRCLQLNNRDEGMTVNQEQFYEKVWEWSEIVLKRLNITPESFTDEMPQVQIFLTLSKNGSDFTIVMCNQNPEITLTDEIFCMAIRQWVLTVVNQCGIKIGGDSGTPS